MDPVVHFEIPADQLDRCKSFYEKTFGWNILEYPGMAHRYLGARTFPGNHGDPQPAGQIGGGILERQDTIKVPLITIQVESIESALETIQKNGGKVVEEKKSVMGMGFTAYFKDSEGNIMGLWENVKK